jgi:translation initiation factor 2 subunit 3
MPGDETLQKHHGNDSDSEEEDEVEVEEQIPTIDVDISKLHPLSPEVISKQVCN